MMLELYQNDPLYLAIMKNDKSEINKLKEKGIVLSEHIRYMLTHAVGSLAVANEYTYAWFGHIAAIDDMNGERLIAVLRNLREAVGEPMYYSGSYSWEWGKRLYTPEMFSCVLDCFDNRKIPKKWVWQKIIDNDQSQLAAIAAEHGWLKMPKKRDELIQYASDNNKTECLAWLLDFKNRTANLAEEQEKAEKKLMRELNANPDSVTELKKLWGFQKQENGNLIITGCKKSAGDRTEITVPEKIGKDTVTAIGEFAFSSFASRLTQQCKAFRRKITKINLPKTIKSIGKCAFKDCPSLEEINIPEGIEVINERTFCYCTSLKELHLPDSVKVIEGSAVCYCPKLVTLSLPRAMEKISEGAFSSCSSLEELKLPKSVKEIERYTFNGCTSLKEIEIPEGVEVLGTYSFNNCRSLEKAVLNRGLKKIEKYVFENCKSLREIIIPEGVEEIGSCSFAGCESLEKIYLPKSLKKIQNLSVKGSAPLTVFDKSPKVKAIVNQGSYAEKYCKRNNIPYEFAEEAND